MASDVTEVLMGTDVPPEKHLFISMHRTHSWISDRTIREENMEGQIIRTEYSEVMQKSYIDYAMSVIVSRALPDVRDGLKPVQRRNPV